MNIFNPVISEKSPNCHCKGCFHAFWLHIEKDRDSLNCHCDLLHSFTFPNFNANEKIILCKGCEDDIPFSKRADRSACRHCKNSLWYITDKRRLYCFCLHLQCLVYGLDGLDEYSMFNIGYSKKHGLLKYKSRLLGRLKIFLHRKPKACYNVLDKKLHNTLTAVFNFIYCNSFERESQLFFERNDFHGSRKTFATSCCSRPFWSVPFHQNR